MEQRKLVVGWREWLALPDLGIEKIAAKVDTGATTSVLHARDVRVIVDTDGSYVEFSPPLLRVQRSPHSWAAHGPRRVRAALIDERFVKSSSGIEERRYVIRTRVKILDQDFLTEFSLAVRSRMQFPVLLGRSALRNRFVVDVATPQETLLSTSSDD